MDQSDMISSLGVPETVWRSCHYVVAADIWVHHDIVVIEMAVHVHGVGIHCHGHHHASIRVCHTSLHSLIELRRSRGSFWSSWKVILTNNSVFQEEEFVTNAKSVEFIDQKVNLIINLMSHVSSISTSVISSVEGI